MIKFALVFSIVLCFQKDVPVISWSESYKLSWRDFKGKPNTHDRAVAVTASGITFGYSIKKTNGRVVDFTTEVKAHFYPEESWCKHELADNHILGHEQLHYDITELYARKFRKEIEVLKATDDVRKRLNKLHNVINKELDELQNLYDTETNYSINVKEQLRWQIYISKKLEELSKYKSVDSQP